MDPKLWPEMFQVNLLRRKKVVDDLEWRAGMPNLSENKMVQVTEVGTEPLLLTKTTTIKWT